MSYRRYWILHGGYIWRNWFCSFIPTTSSSGVSQFDDTRIFSFFLLLTSQLPNIRSWCIRWLIYMLGRLFLERRSNSHVSFLCWMRYGVIYLNRTKINVGQGGCYYQLSINYLSILSPLQSRLIGRFWSRKYRLLWPAGIRHHLPAIPVTVAFLPHSVYTWWRWLETWLELSNDGWFQTISQ